MIRMALINNLFKERLRLHSPILASLEKLRLRRNKRRLRRNDIPELLFVKSGLFKKRH